MKKNYYRNGFDFFLSLSVMIATILGCLWLMISIAEKWWHYIFLIIIIVLFIWSIYKHIGYKIELNEDYIFVDNDNSKIQYRTTIKYEDIEDIEICLFKADSNLKPIYGKPYVMNRFLVFVLKNQERKRIYITYYSKKRVLNIAQEIANRSNIELSEKFIKDINKIIKY